MLLPPAVAGSGTPPKILTATATWQRTEGMVAFSVEVQRKPRRVTVHHAGVRLRAHHVKSLHAWWSTGAMPSQKKRCYRIRVKARNRHGLTTRRMGAGRIGSKGCPSSPGG